MKLSRRFTLTTAIVAIVLYAATSARSDEVENSIEPQQDPPTEQVPEASKLPEPPLPAPQQQSDDEWAMEIQPASKVPFVLSEPIPLNPTATDAGHIVTFDRAEYSRIYNSIPFNRAEYDVNPNYRHDSTMEILTGNSRHQTIVKHDFEHKQPVRRIPAPTRPSRILVPFNLPYMPFGSSFGYGFGSPGLRF